MTLRQPSILQDMCKDRKDAMKKLILVMLAAAVLSGCMGNTINIINVEQQGTATITNDEDGKTTTATPTTAITAPLTQ